MQTAVNQSRASSVNLRKMVFTALLACLSFVLSTFVNFPQMAPFQHLCNVIGAVLLGPYYGFCAALLTGLMRMLWGRTIQAVVGAVIGAFLSGLCYRYSKKLWAAVAGEIVGTGMLSALAVYPLMVWLYGLPADSHPFYFYIPFYLPSAILGAVMGVCILGILKRSGYLAKLQLGLGV